MKTNNLINNINNMETKKEKVFADGLIYKAPNENAPDFVKGAISIKVDEFKEFLDKHNKKGWVNLDFLKSQKGSLYFALNTFEPEKKSFGEMVEEAKPTEQNVDIDTSAIPF